MEKQPKQSRQAVVVWDHGSFVCWSWTIILNVLIYNNPCECIVDPVITCS